MTCAQITDLFADYIMGSLTPAELAMLDEHLRDCPTCRADLRELEESAASVWAAVRQVEPPPHLRQRVMAAVEAGRTALPGPVPLPARRRAGRSVWSFVASHLAAAMSALALLLVIGLGYWVVMLRNDVHSLAAENASLTQQVTRQRYAMYALRESFELMNSTARTERALRGSEAAPQARGVVYYDPQERMAMLVTSQLPRPAPDRSYQVWVRGSTGVVSVGLLTFDEGDVGYSVLHTPAPIGEFQWVGISNEPAGGSPQPTGQRMMNGTL